MTDPLPDEDAKLVTLARAARARIDAEQGAALRDETGRTYAAAAVRLPSVSLGALVLVVAASVGAGATGVEAVVVVGADPDATELAALRDLGGSGVPVLVCATDGTPRARLLA